MFGIGFTELLLIAVIAILFLGPDKLPGTLVEIAKFIRSIKKTINDTKSSLEEEMRISELKEEALNYKKQLTETTQELQGFKNITLEELDEIETTMEPPKDSSSSTQDKNKNEAVTLKKTSQKETKGNA